MSSSRGNGGGLDSDDQSKKVSSDPNEKMRSPASHSVPCEDVRTDENLVDLDNPKLHEEIARRNLLYLAGIHQENQQLYEEVLKQTKKTNAALAKQSELYDKLILGTSKSIGADCMVANTPDTNVKVGSKRLLVQEETSEAGSKKLQKMNSEEDQSSEDPKN